MTPAERLTAAAQLARETAEAATPGLSLRDLGLIVERASVNELGCWVWSTTNGNGYGHVPTAEGKMEAHLWLWELVVGPIADGLVLDHLCRNRACANPEHMDLVTNAENIRRGHEARRTYWCDKHGMKAMLPQGRRACKPCRADRARERRAARVGSPDTPHGTADGYSNWACRCEACKGAQRERDASQPPRRRRAA